MELADVRLSDLATKRDLEKFTTKEDLVALEGRMNAKFDQVTNELDSIHGKLDILLNGHKPQGS